MEKKLKVLIADNTAEFGVPCSNLLKTYGMDVVLTPKEGSRLLTEVKSVKPDVLIMDAFMPKMDALGVLKTAGIFGNPSSPADHGYVHRVKRKAGKRTAFFGSIILPFKAG